jgi:uncharacterized pyridoxamine 5'-phosphate oxidase family protein
MSWIEFEKDSPDLASLGIEKLNRKIVYLAILKKDGSPRLNPVTPFIENGKLFMFTEPTSPKIRDIRRDGRYVMHCSVSREGPLIEFLVSGNAEEITDSIVRKQAENIAALPVVDESYALFEFQVERVLAVEYDEENKKVIRRWNREKVR